uniref:Pumilio-like protein 2 n=1 Tax=Enchytraeus coronatus TaxID=208440 RepID=A0AAU7VFF2_9ANNE
MPVLTMQETNSWEDARSMLGNDSDIASLTGSMDGRGPGGVASGNVVSRSQDDARVGYFFQRPQAVMLNQQFNNKRWAGDEAFPEQARTVTDLEREFHRLAFENSEEDATLKMWTTNAGNLSRSSGGVDGNLSDSAVGKSGSAGMFQLASLPNNPWLPREDFWGGGPQADTSTLSDLMHTATGHRRPGSFPGSTDLSQHGADNSNLGINMAEYVLGTSPGMSGPGPIKDNMDVRQRQQQALSRRYVGGSDADNSRLEQDQDALHMNGVLQNGLEEKSFSRAPGSRQNSPTEADHQSTMSGPHQSMAHKLNTSLTSAVAGNNISMETMSGYGMLTSAGVGGVMGGINNGMGGINNGMGGFNNGMGGMNNGMGGMNNGMGGMNNGMGMAIDNMGMPHMGGLTLDVPQQMEIMGFDPFQGAIYQNHLMQGGQPPPQPGAAPPPMESPNFSIDYTHQMMQAAARQQQQQQQAAAIGPPQMMMPGQQQYALPTDQILGQTMMPQFYNVQPSWPMYQPQAMLHQQQQQRQQQLQSGQQTPTGPGTPQPVQQLLRTQMPTRPMTPQQQQQQQMDAMTPIQTPGAGGPGFQVITPAFYDQNGQLFMNTLNSSRHVVRLVSPGHPAVLMTGGQQGYAAPAYTPTVSTGMLTPRASATPVFLNPQQGMNPGNPGGAGGIGPIGTGLVQPRRDSFGSLDLKQLTFAGAPQFNQWYGGAASLSPGGAIGIAHTMTPPPNNPGLLLPGLGLNAAIAPPGRLYSAAPGAEAKYRNGSLTLNPAVGQPGSMGLFGTSLFNQQTFSKSDGISKDVAGRSQLLEDFRNNRMPNLQLRDLVDHVVEFSQDQHGSRFIQQKLEHANASEKLMVFNEILSSAHGLMTDVFGNYVIQKFLEFGSTEQKHMLTQRVRGHVLALALHMYGCRVIQKALESVPLEMQVEVLKELEGHILKCVKDQNGNHVVQKCIECIEPAHLSFITDSFKGQVLNLAMHPYGCRVIQRILEHCTAEQIACIMDELREHTEHLVFDQYGNYVIQHVLEHGRPDDKTLIVNQLRGKILPLSQHKFASNVIEKCVSHASRAERALIIEEVCNMNDGAQSALYTMMKDQFANYVVQKMIDIADPAQRKLLLQKIRPHVATLRKYAYGKHILAKLEKFYAKNNAELGPIGNPISNSSSNSSSS